MELSQPTKKLPLPSQTRKSFGAQFLKLKSVLYLQAQKENFESNLTEW